MDSYKCTSDGWRPSPPRQAVHRIRLAQAVPATFSLDFEIRSVQNRKKPPAAHQAVPEEHLELASDFHEAISDVDIKTVITLFPELQKRGLIDRTLTWRTAQCLHEAFRRHRRLSPYQRVRADSEEMVAFAGRLTNAIVKAEIEPARRGHLHILTFFKESQAHSEGVKFWTWLEEQGDEYVDRDVYGAAIELLAVQGTPLPELEDLYERALQRFPGGFNAYHLSPHAVVPDRDQAVQIQGLSVVLLQSILTARLLRGDSRRAYQALDTAFRLLPTQVPLRFFGLFVEERPVSEAYTVFAMACRAGIVCQLGTTRQLLTALRSDTDMSSPTAHTTVLRQMVSVLYMYIGAGGTLTSNAVNELIIAYTQILRLEGMAGLPLEHKQSVVSLVLDATRKTLEIIARYGAVPGIAAFNSIIINLAGYGQSKHIIGTALKDMHALGLEPNQVTRRSVLVAAGLLGDDKYVREAWTDLADACVARGETPSVGELRMLVRASKQSGCETYARGVILARQPQLPDDDSQSLLEHLLSPNEERAGLGDGSTLDGSSLLTQMEKLNADLSVVEKRTQNRPATQNFDAQGLPMTMQSLHLRQPLPEAESRALYDELTTEHSPSTTGALSQNPQRKPQTTRGPKSGSIVHTASRAMSTTEVPYGTLRYRHWQDINYLLALAESNDAIYNQAVDDAISAGVAPPSMAKALRMASPDTGNYRGLSDMEDGVDEVQEAGGAEQVQKGRDEILRRRGRVAAA
ncbi:hypothetical protein LTR53_003788 [Teratosphaeriaceae sp. CCFEE 6253]|nr:hypothetical protein LTR53_003788 [Teratosphaeriaceae sp. CCFEE 6253]